MARQTIDFQNTSGGPLSLDKIAIPNNEVAAAATVRLTDFVSVAEALDDEQVHAHIDAGDAILIINGVTLNQAESQAALQPASSQTIAEEGGATAPVQEVFGRTGNVTAQAGDYTPAQVGADPAGTAATAISNHEGLPDPHSQYTTTAEAAAAAPVQKVNGQTGAVSLKASDVRADPVGTATAAVAAHEAAKDPHPQYTTADEAAAAAPVQSVNGETGTVTLDAADVGADPAGAATTQVALHEAKIDPHPQYTTSAEAAAAAPVQSVNGETGTVILDASDVGADPSGTASAAVSAHEAASDPHPGYQLESEKGAANGYASLDGSGQVPVSQLGNVAGGLSYQGTWNAATNTPTITSGVGTNGHYYRVAVAGTTSIDGIADWGVGDWIIFNGTAWEKIDNSEAVSSVFGRTGAVTAQTGDYTPAQVGADPAGTAAAAVAAHEAAPDPHPQYTTAAEAAAAAPVQSVNGETGTVILDAGDVGADPTGTAAAAVSAHEAAPDPHPQYTTAAEAAAAAPVQSVNGDTGVVVLDAADVGADSAGTALTQVALHEMKIDPHPQYTTAVEAAAAAPVQSVNGDTGVVVLNAADVGADPAGTAAAAVSAHEAAGDPHPQYTTAAEASVAAPVQSVFGRVGAVAAQASDYDANQVDYSNATSGLSSTNVQAAIDEVEGRVDTLEAQVYSGNRVYASEEGTASTTGSNVARVTLNTGSIPAGTYRLEWYAELTTNTTGQDVEAGVLFDDTLVADINIELKDSRSWVPFSGFYEAALGAGSYTMVLGYGSERENTAQIRRARLVFIRVA